MRLPPAARLPALVLVLFAGGIGLGSVALAQEAPTPTGTPVPLASAASTPVAEGRVLYLRYCAYCHGQQGGGSQRGPTIINQGAASADWWISTGRMPLAEETAVARRGPVQFARPQIDALVAYIATLGSGPAIPTLQPGDASKGAEIYLENCAACHSSGGIGYTQVGGRAASPILPDTPTQVAEAVRIGPNLMPSYPEQAIDQQELNDVVSYVQALHSVDEGGWSLGRVGPVLEAVVGFFGVGALVLVVRRLGEAAP